MTQETRLGSPVRVGLIGLGGAAERIHLPALRSIDGVEVVGGVDGDATRRRWASEAAIPATFETVNPLLDLKPDIVVIATPPATHAELAVRSLEAGCHVFCEKPFVSSVEEADAVVAAVERTGRQLAVNNQYRQMLIYRKTRAALSRGLFGDPYLLQIWQQMNLPPDHDPPWRAALSKRILFEFATHAIDLVSYLYGDHPIAVSARTPRVTSDQAADLIVLVRLDLPGGRVANLVFNRRSEAPQKYLEMRLDCERASIRLSLGGLARFDAGWSTEQRRPKLRLSVVRGGEARVERNGRSRVLARDAVTPYSPATARHFQGFLDAIRQGRTPEGSAIAARELIRTVFAAYQSAENDGDLVEIRRPPEAARVRSNPVQ